VTEVVEGRGLLGGGLEDVEIEICSVWIWSMDWDGDDDEYL
jgi:hypothetical protein